MEDSSDLGIAFGSASDTSVLIWVLKAELRRHRRDLLLVVGPVIADIWTRRKGKAVRCQSYHEPAQWLEGLGETNPEA